MPVADDVDNIVLVLDDDRATREVLFEYLKSESLRVELVRTSAEVLARVQRGGVGVVIGDLMQPGLGGFEALRRILAHPPPPAPPANEGVAPGFGRPEVIVLTGYGTIEGAVRAMQLGAAHFLQKPASAEALRAAVLRSLAARRLAAVHAPALAMGELAGVMRRLLDPQDIDELVQSALAALQACTSARGALLVAWHWGEREPRLDVRGLSEDDARAFVTPVEEALLARPAWPRRSDAPRLLERTQAPVMVLPVSRGQTSAALVAVAPEEGRFTEESSARAACVADHFAYGFANVQRSADAAGLNYVDDLTGLYNARYFDVALAREIAEATAVEQTAPRSLGLLLIDVDQARSINERFGHLVGSKVLVEMGRVLRRCVREVDPVFRHGGDDFAVLLRGADKPGALHIAERIRASVETHPFLSREGLDVRLTISLAVACFPADARSKERLLDLADGTLHRGKGGGRNAVHAAEAAPNDGV